MPGLPLVSVIVPTHNRPEFLRKTIESILGQSYRNLELIVVSNGVSAKNKKTVGEFSDPRVRYAEQENSGGPASPRNHGIRLAKGTYIAFCDDDDLWIETKLEKQISSLQQNIDCGLCYTDMLRFDKEKEWSVPHEQGNANLDTLLYINTVPISSVAVRKKLVDKLGGFCESKAIGISEDYEFLLRYAVHTRFIHINEFLVKYWSGGNRTSLEEPEILRAIKYFLGVLGCYQQLINKQKVPVRKIFLPALYQLKITLKIVVFQLRHIKVVSFKKRK